MSQHPLVCLDAGHGNGCPNQSPDGRYFEAEFAWDLSQQIAQHLHCLGVPYCFTRGAEDYPSLSVRCQRANTQPSLRLYVSLHSNAVGTGGWQTPSGHMLFTAASGADALRNRAGRCFLARWKEAAVPLATNPHRHEPFTVLTGTRAPAVLLEHGFHTSKTDVEDLCKPAFRQKLARADALAIADFLGVDTSKLEGKPLTERQRVQARFSLADSTMDYLCAYRFADELLQRLTERA